MLYQLSYAGTRPALPETAGRRKRKGPLGLRLAIPCPCRHNGPGFWETAMTTSPETAGRAMLPDLIRAFALFGIAVVNVMAFSQPLASGFHDGGLDTQIDQAAFLAMSGLFLMKSYPLFSMMFGAGLAYQLDAAERAGKAFAPRYFRRMTALIVLGILHFIFFWIGDILMTYGILGCLLFLMRDLSAKALARIGIALIALNTALLLALGGMIWALETVSPDAIAEFGYEEMNAASLRAFGEGRFGDAAAYRLGLLPVMLPSVIFQQGLSVFGFFCFGLAAVKSGIIDQPQAPFWRLARRVYLPIGFLGSLAGAWVLLQAESSVDSKFLLGSAITMGFSAFSALGYAGIIAALSGGRAGPVRAFLAKAGSASLTAYIVQSVLFSAIFTAYGFSQFGRMSAAEAIGTAALVALVSLVFTGLWRSFAPRGPMEVLLRRITYWGRA